MKNKNLKKERGITLVALVITIVVLLILAAVAIVSLSGENNIISKAQKARDDYNEAKQDEDEELKNLNWIGKYIVYTDPTAEDGAPMQGYAIEMYISTVRITLNNESTDYDLRIEKDGDETKAYAGGKFLGTMAYSPECEVAVLVTENSEIEDTEDVTWFKAKSFGDVIRFLEDRDDDE